MVYKKVDVRVGNTKKKRELFLKRKIEKCVSILRRDLSRIYDLFKKRWKNGNVEINMNWKGNAKQKVEALIVPEIETLNEDNK